MSRLNLPDGWTQLSLGSFMDFKNGVNADKEAYGKGVKFVNVLDIFRKNYLESQCIIGSVNISDEQLEEYSVEMGDILFNRTSETPEDIALSSVYLSEEKITFGGFVIRGRQKKRLIDPLFAKYCFHTDSVRKEMIRRCQGAVRANIGQKDLSKIQVIIPTIEDQKLIVKILDKWEVMVNKIESLIILKEQKYNWLVTKLINKSCFKRKQLADYVSEISKRNSENKIDRVLSVTNNNGFVLSEERFERRLASTNVTNYKVVLRGEFAYSPPRINVGSIARLDNWSNGIVSPMYIVFNLEKSSINSNYFLHWLSSNETKQRIKNSTQGSVRETVSFQDFGAIKIPLPNIKKQEEISHFLDNVKQEIELLKNLAIKYRIQKRGLMQKLLSGEWQNKIKEST